MHNPLGKFLLVLTFFTRLPLPASLGERVSHDTGLGSAAGYFPIVGLLAAIIPALVFWISAQVVTPGVAAMLALVAGLLLTGALHEDGLADCADGFGATPDRKKALEIMRDSRIGSYGALALGGSLLLRFAALSALGAMAGAMAILIAWTVSRSAITLAMYFSDYARPEGLGKMASDPMSDLSLAASILFAAAIGLFLGGWAGITAVVLALAAGWIVLKYLEYRLDGYTGDGLGAMQQLSEITALLVLVGFWA